MTKKKQVVKNVLQIKYTDERLLRAELDASFGPYQYTLRVIIPSLLFAMFLTSSCNQIRRDRYILELPRKLSQVS